jgi:ubiquinone/menaquinone biosynthesis C-methylase UbiE
MTTDLHDTFGDPARGGVDAMERFLDDVDRMPGIRAIQRAMRGALDLRPGMQLVDAGCGTGLEAARLAADHPAVAVMGVDRNPALLATARRRAAASSENLAWVEADLAGRELPADCCDALRLERVLLRVPDVELGHALDGIVAMVRPGGRLALFDLDYGGTILPALGHGPGVVEDAVAALARSAAQPSIRGAFLGAFTGILATGRRPGAGG